MTTPDWLERLTGGTRLRILERLRRRESSVQDVADEVGVTPNAVRGHLSALERDGLVRASGVRRDTGGKPATLYDLAPEGDELFPKGYVAVFVRLLQALDDEMGAEGVEVLLERVGAQVAHPATGPAQERVEAAAALLRGLGGDVEILRDEDAWTIRGFACPLSAVVREEPRVCRLAEAMVRAQTGGEVIETCDRSDRPRCCFVVRFPSDGTES